jgi:hypothetical protein
MQTNKLIYKSVDNNRDNHNSESSQTINLLGYITFIIISPIYLLRLWRIKAFVPIYDAKIAKCKH